MKLVQTENQVSCAWITFWCIVLSIIIICVSFICTSAEAGEVKIKGGYIDILCKPIDSYIILEVSYEEQYKQAGAELGLLCYKTYINDVGELFALNPSLTLKYYIKALYMGCGGGYSLNLMDDVYDIDNEWTRHITIGLENGDWGLEVRRTFEDLDLETGFDYEPPGGIERYSRLDSWIMLITRKF